MKLERSVSETVIRKNSFLIGHLAIRWWFIHWLPGTINPKWLQLMDSWPAWLNSPGNIKFPELIFMISSLWPAIIDSKYWSLMSAGAVVCCCCCTTESLEFPGQYVTHWGQLPWRHSTCTRAAESLIKWTQWASLWCHSDSCVDANWRSGILRLSTRCLRYLFFCLATRNRWSWDHCHWL